ncbi:MAG: hypothetical protein DHS20C19_29550 [Acidimicrobiales bacterium]|nr:MAG: hypothetical protein DHS20C19_29550 [Acidimicrobiales bacterium]
MSRAELILYATPNGPLADALYELFDRLRRDAPTTAQTYPPHCTLTGFFHRGRADVARVIDDAHAAVTAVAPPASVTVERLRLAPDWVGLELTAPWLLAVTEAFADRHVLGDGDDALRPKDWLHLSIAYGDGDLDTAASLASEMDPTLDAAWDVGVWERAADGSWTDLSRRR